jgi:hypothetical protein
MTHRMDDPEQDPEREALLDEIRAITAGLRDEDVDVDLADPALKALVDCGIEHYEGWFTPEGEQEARRRATFALATHPDIEPVLERVRRQQASGVRSSRSADDLGEVAQRVGGRRGS